MSITVLTYKNKNEIDYELEHMKNNKRHQYRMEMPDILVQNNNIIRVSSCRTVTFWNLKINEQGEITISKYIRGSELFNIFTLIIINIAIAFVMFINGFTVEGATIFSVIAISSILFTYYFNVISPCKTVKRFIYKYLGGIE